MGATEILNKIKTELGMKVNLETAVLEDGVTQIEAEVLAEGNEIFIVMEEEKVPLPIGEYTLDDGRVLVVQEEGIIFSIGEAIIEDEKPTEPAKEEAELENAGMPKKIVETQTRETHFEHTPEHDVVETIESVEEEIMGEVSTIIADLTPESVSESDASAMAVAVVEQITSTLDAMPEEMVSKMMMPKKKYGKNKMSEEDAEVISDAEGEVATAVAEVIEAETPDDVTPEIAEEIANVVTEVVEEIVAEAPEELRAQLLKKKETKKEKMAKQTRAERIALAKERIAKLNSKSKKPSVKPLKHNPEVSKEQKVEFRIAKNRTENTMDRVMRKLFK